MEILGFSEVEMTDLVCVHIWSMWFNAGFEEEPKWRQCMGLCKSFQRENEQEPRVIVARLEPRA